MIDRRSFISSVAVTVITAPLAGEAQSGRVARIGLLWPGASSPPPPRLEAFRQGLSESGYVDGQNMIIELRYAEGEWSVCLNSPLN